MSKLSILSSFPVAITILVAGAPKKLKDFEFSDISSIELMAARSQASEGEYIPIYEYIAKTKLIDTDGTKHEIPYDVIAGMSSVNFKKLEELDYELQLKLIAVSLENPSS